MTSTAAAMPSSGMDMGREKSLRKGSGAPVAGAAASLPRSFLMGLFRIWKGDSASLHAARATRPREHLRRAAFFRGAWFWFCGGVGPPHHERGLVGTPPCERAGVHGALRPQNAKRLSSEEGASSQPRITFMLREAAFPGSERRRRG